MWGAVLVAVVASYIIGSFPTAYLLARWRRGIDIRRYGTGNVGGTNVGVHLGVWATVLVGITDIIKGALPTLVVRELGLGVGLAALAGLAAVIGHDWSLFLGFKGGRGMATTLGCLLVLLPWGVVIVLASLLIGRLLSRTALVNGLGVAVLPVVALLGGEPVVLVLFCLGLVIVTAVKRLLANGEPYPTDLPPSRVCLNRLLHDRDVAPTAPWGLPGERR